MDYFYSEVDNSPIVLAYLQTPRFSDKPRQLRNLILRDFAEIYNSAVSVDSAVSVHPAVSHLHRFRNELRNFSRAVSFGSEENQNPQRSPFMLHISTVTTPLSAAIFSLGSGLLHQTEKLWLAFQEGATRTDHGRGYAKLGFGTTDDPTFAQYCCFLNCKILPEQKLHQWLSDTLKKRKTAKERSITKKSTAEEKRAKLRKGIDNKNTARETYTRTWPAVKKIAPPVEETYEQRVAREMEERKLKIRNIQARRGYIRVH